jgi:hypothetical protein
MRQSAGKRVKNRLATACLDHPASTLPAAWLWVARIRNPVLLKTASRNPASRGHFRRALTASIDAVQGLMQRGSRHSIRQKPDPVVAAPPTEPDPAPPPTSRHSCGDSSARSAPVAASEGEEGVFPRTHADGTDTLHARHIRDRGTHGKDGTSRGQGETLHTSWPEFLL